ncbi:succinate dehydrogenase, cytochrome b556 subunit [Reinekea sp. G2M2-21]|uniref:succinate dehydrogenase, cytochrome b556 subunit n=1 Tax=Reinekea sp. G2M2-21 TaxID=2788942 RepID=UPI0018A98E5A|nr:succinate dehydrogenase, cytochrome b556 subunit [Reinekea sp.]
MKNNRPVNLDLTTIRMPLSAIASITHRITGVGLFVAVGFLMWALTASLESQAGFEQVKNVLTHPFAKFIAWGIASFVVYHLVAGIKHLFMDIGYFETKEGGALASKAVFALSAVGIILVGVWVW